MGGKFMVNRDKTGTPGRPKKFVPALPVLLFFIVASSLTALGDRPPGPLGTDASSKTFSAKRAFLAYAKALGGNRPHPTGSDGQKRMSDRLVGLFREMGYNPQVQESWACSRWSHIFARTRNILVRLEGNKPDQALLVTAHYDSVPCGTGAMDDGVGTAAILEIARILREGPKPRHPVVFLLSDGEEIGLIGARAFQERHPWAKSVRFVIGVDSGGDGGSSLISQTAGNDRWLADSLRGIPHPAGSSAMGGFVEAFRLVGGTSDFDEYERAGRTGVNLINAGWTFNHHTPWDNTERMNLGTLQDHGDHALSMIGRLAYGRWEERRNAPGVYFDLWGRVLVHYSRAWSWVIQLFALLLGLGPMIFRNAKGRSSMLLTIAKGFGGWLLVLAAGSAGGAAVIFCANRFTWPPEVETGHPALMLGLILATAALTGALAYRASVLPLGKGSFRMGTLVAWNLMGLAVCGWIPGAAYLFGWPVLAAGVFGRIFPEDDAGRDTAFWLPFGATATVLWLPMLFRLSAVEPPNLLSAVLFLLLWVLFLPTLRLGKGEFGRVGLVALLVVPALIVPWMTFDGPHAQRPRSYGNIAYLLDNDGKRAVWILPGKTPTPIWRAAGRVRWVKLKNPIIGPGRRLPVAVAPFVRLAGPEATLERREDLRQGRIRWIIRVRGGRRARALWVAVSPRPLLIKADGVTMTPHPPGGVPRRPNPKDPWERLSLVGRPGWVELELITSSRHAVRLSLLDQTEGLPTRGRRLLKARPDDSVPYQNGDLTLVGKTFLIRY